VEPIRSDEPASLRPRDDRVRGGGRSLGHRRLVRRPCPVAWEAQERALKHTFAMFLPMAMAALLPGCGPVSGTRLGPWAGPPPSAMALAEASPLTRHLSMTGPCPAAPDVASRYHRRGPLQGPND
jgi:hypothetical protein